MKPITLPGVEEYATNHTSRDPHLLVALADQTRLCFETADMMIGPLEGRFLQMLMHALRPKVVLEIGTFTGYSALTMAAALPPSGRIISCEANHHHADVASRNIAASPYAESIQIEVGPALATIKRLDCSFDFVFIDADKQNYMNYFEAVLPKLTDRGLIAADNTLWDGYVVDESNQDEETRALRHFNDAVASDDRIVCVLLTVRDGVTLIRRRDTLIDKESA